MHIINLNEVQKYKSQLFMPITCNFPPTSTLGHHEKVPCMKKVYCGSVVAEQLRAPNSNSGVSDQQSGRFESPAVTLVSLSKTHCFVLQMGRKAVGPMCCVNACKRTQCTYRKREGVRPCVPGWIGSILRHSTL